MEKKTLIKTYIEEIARLTLIIKDLQKLLQDKEQKLTAEKTTRARLQANKNRSEARLRKRIAELERENNVLLYELEHHRQFPEGDNHD